MATNFVTATSTKLLAGLADGGCPSAWQTLDNRLRPVVNAAAARLGLGPEDAEEVTQLTLVKAYDGLREGKFTGGKGKLRHWILAIARNAAFDVLRRKGQHPQAGSVGEERPDEQRVTAVFSEEWRRTILRRAFELLQTSTRLDPRSVRAFELLVLHGVPVREVASQCEMSEDQVYVAKNRVRAKFMELYEQLSDSDENDL